MDFPHDQAYGWGQKFLEFSKLIAKEYLWLVVRKWGSSVEYLNVHQDFLDMFVEIFRQ